MCKCHEFYMNRSIILVSGWLGENLFGGVLRLIAVDEWVFVFSMQSLVT